jgi:hypothetical protein
MAMQGDRIRLVRRAIYIYPRGAPRSAVPVKQANVNLWINELRLPHRRINIQQYRMFCL